MSKQAPKSTAARCDVPSASDRGDDAEHASQTVWFASRMPAATAHDYTTVQRPDRALAVARAGPARSEPPEGAGARVLQAPGPFSDLVGARHMGAHSWAAVPW